MDARQYFGVSHIKDITWAHATNSKEKLKQAFANAVMMIEGDICVCDSDPSKIVMAHPPLRESDLTFQAFIDEVLESVLVSNIKVGIKLDIKDPPAVLPILQYMKQKFGNHPPPLPVWVNADLWQGTDGIISPFNPSQFIELTEEYSPAQGAYVLSIGWTTAPVGMNPDLAHTYTVDQMNDAIKACKKYNLKNVTFPIRISMARNSLKELNLLLDADPTYTLTLWKGKEGVSEEDLSYLVSVFDPNRIFLDVL